MTLAMDFADQLNESETGRERHRHRSASDRYHAVIEGATQDLQDVASELRQFIQKEKAIVGQRDLARHRHLALTDQPHIRDGVVGARHGSVVMKAGRSPVRPATRWRRVVSRTSAKVICGNIDFPAPGGAEHEDVMVRTSA
jgi:hypothetical protein